MTNYEKIKNMPFDELIEKVFGGFASCECCTYNGQDYCVGHCQEGFKEWLNQEAEEKK